MVDSYSIIPVRVNSYYYKGKTPEGRANNYSRSKQSRPTNLQSFAEHIKMSTEFQKGSAQAFLSHFVLLERKLGSVSKRKKGPGMDERTLYHDRIVFKRMSRFKRCIFN